MLEGVISSVRPDTGRRVLVVFRPTGAAQSGAATRVPPSGAPTAGADQIAAGQATSGVDRIGAVPGLGSGAQQNLLASAGEAEATNPDGLSPEQEELVDDLAARDREVKAHEEAHARVGGQYAGQPSYTYQQGPDGKRYAIGGEVPIDVAPVPDDPEATIEKMRVVKAAALAPAEPSGQDRAVAQLADAQSLAAQAELNSTRSTDRIDALTGGPEAPGQDPEQDEPQLIKSAAALDRAANEPGTRFSLIV